MMKRILFGVVSVIVVCTITFLVIYTPFYVVQQLPHDPYSVARRALKTGPLVDGHNGLPNNLMRLLKNRLEGFDYRQNLTEDPLWGMETCDKCHSDIPRLVEGLVGSMWWVAGTACETEFKDAVEQTMEQIDVIYRFADQYRDVIQFSASPFDIEYASYDSKIGSLIKIEGGHAIDNRLSVLRNYYKLGARAMTLAHNCNTPWVESSITDEENIRNEERNSTGLSEFGLLVVKEMNRLGMIIDLTHSSLQTQMDVFNQSRAPVIFSHSNAYALCADHRNVHDDVLHLLRDNGGLVMVNFHAPSVNCSEEATIAEVAEHVNYIRNVSGIDHVGIGSLFDTTNSSTAYLLYFLPLMVDFLLTRTVEGLNDVTKYIELFAYLASDEDNPWTELELQKLAGKNFLRVFQAVEQVREQMWEEGEVPAEDWIPEEDLRNHTECITHLDDSLLVFFRDEL